MRETRECRGSTQERLSEERFEAIFNQAIAGIVVVDADGTITQANASFCDLVGYSEDELKAMRDPIATLTHRDEVEANKAHSAAVMRGEMPSFELEKRYLHKDGKEVWANLRVAALRDQDGQIHETVGIAENIDERKRAEAALQASEHHLDLVLDSLVDYAIFSLDLQGRVTRWSGGAARQLGYEEREVLGEPVDFIFTEEDRRVGASESEMRGALETGQSLDDRWHVRKDRSHFWANGILSLLVQREGEPCGFVKILRDHTDEMRAQAQIEERARQQAAVAHFGQRALSGVPLEQLFDEAVQTIAETLDVPFCELLRALPNERALRLDAGAGWGEGLVGHARVGTELNSQAGYTLASDQPVVVEDLRSESRFTPPSLLLDAGVVSGITVVILGHAGPWGVLGAHTREHREFSADDVNFLQAMSNSLAAAIERSRTEDRLRELNQNLEARVAERTAELEQRAMQLQALTSELTQTEQRERRHLAQVLHDHLQQMLVAGKLQISGALHAAERGEPVTDPLHRLGELLDQAIQESRSLTVELSPPVIYEEGLTAGLEWLGRWMQEQHGLSVDISASEDADPAAEDLRILLFRAARELLFNVIKHAAVDQAEVTLRRDRAQCIELSVYDRGRGLAETPPAEDSEGDTHGGFGLVSIRERAARLGGEFGIEPRSGGGTRARLTLPESPSTVSRRTEQQTHGRGTEDEQTAPALPESDPPTASDAIRVVVADDHDITRKGLVSVLASQSDLELVGEAGDGESAVDLVRRHCPDVVVLDVTMPRMNGIEAARIITDEFPDIRVIGLSVHEAGEMADAMRNAGASEYLDKGDPSLQLLAAIRRETA